MSAIVDKDGVVVREIPAVDANDPSSLEIWYGNFGHFEILRKSVLSSCREVARATALKEGVKLSDEKSLDLARIAPAYLDYVIDHMPTRQLREDNVRDSLAGR